MSYPKKSVFLVFVVTLLTSVVADTDCGYNPPSWSSNPTVQSGTSSWFSIVSQGGGACGWTPNDSDVYVAAISQPTLAEMCGQCGNCFNVTGPDVSVVVRVVDYCDLSQGPCAANGWTLDQTPFTIIAGSTSVGSVSVTFFPVACPETGDFVYSWGPGANQYYVPLHVGFHRYPLESVEIELNGVYQNLPQSVVDIWWYNPDGSQNIPTTVKFTDTAGQVVTDTISTSLSTTGNFNGGVQFPLLSGGGDGSGGDGSGSGGSSGAHLTPPAIYNFF